LLPLLTSALGLTGLLIAAVGEPLGDHVTAPGGQLRSHQIVGQRKCPLILFLSQRKKKIVQTEWNNQAPVLSRLDEEAQLFGQRNA